MADQVSAMPERVWLICDPANNEPGEYTVIDPGQPERLAPCYVPESRLRAAEARVREVEALLDARNFILDLGEKAMADELAAIRAERDALVPLARFAMRVHDTGDNTADAAVADGVLVWVRDSECDESPAFTQARAILAREAGE